MMTRRILSLIVLLGCALTLGACGKRPGKVDAPDTVVEDKFPNIYPDPATDPKP